MTISRRGWMLRVSIPPVLAATPSACSVLGTNDEPNPKQPVLMEISISADADANIDTHERGAPILLRIYELASSIGFLESDFFALQDRDKITLASDILSVDTFMLRPGETRSIRRKAQAGTTAIGVFAAYRDLPASVWRVSHALAPAADAHWYRKAPKLRLGVAVQARGLLVKDADALPEAGQPARARESAKLLPTSVPAAPSLPAAPPAPAMPSLTSVPSVPSVPSLPSLSDIKP